MSSQKARIGRHQNIHVVLLDRWLLGSIQPTLQESKYFSKNIFKEGSANWVDRILQFHYFCRILHREDDAVTLRVLELQLIFFLWSILGPSVPSQYNISMYTHQAHHLSDRYMLKHENYKKNR